MLSTKYVYKPYIYFMYMYKYDLALKIYNGWYAIKTNQIISLTYMYKEDLALNNLLWLIYHKPNQTKSYISKIYV